MRSATSVRIVLALAVAAASVLAATPTVAASEPCYGHTAYVLPLAYRCEGGDCETVYLAGLPIGCTGYIDA